MKNKFITTLLTSIFVLFVSNSIFAQQYICFGAVKNYSVDLADGTTGTIGSTYEWSINEAAFQGVISGNPSFTGNSITINWATTPPGNYTLKVIETNSDGCLGLPITLNITINALPTITGNSLACINATLQLTGSATANATNPWVSSNPAVATVSSTGLVTGITAGTTTITYTNSNGCSITKVITINAQPTTSPINFD
ncbi:MAG: Ig-like domain-containing protein [Dolichospermum sp.]